MMHDIFLEYLFNIFLFIEMREKYLQLLNLIVHSQIFRGFIWVY